MGDAVWMGDALFCVGLVAYHQGEYAAAQTLLEESLRLSQGAGYELGMTYPLNALGNLANLQGDYVAAQMFYEESLRLRRKLAYKGGIAATLADVANVHAKLAQYTTARAHYQESLTLYGELGNKRGMVSVLSGLACLAQVRGQPLGATRLLSAVEALLAQLRARLDEPQYSDMQQAIVAAHAQLDQAIFTAARAEGQAMTLEQAVAYALEGSTMDAELPARATATQ
jgi:tetratricopeptide (TPR) repeat protein